MTSTNFQVGFPDDQNSKRAEATARGRAHTDIFGISEQVQHQPKKNLHSSDLKNILMEDSEDGKETKQNKETKENKTDNMQVPTPQRVRMPPGGFSSSLW